MRYTQLIFLNLLLLLGCSESEKIEEPLPPTEVIPPPPTAVDFSKAMEDRIVWDSTGEDLIGKEGKLFYQTTVRYSTSEELTGKDSQLLLRYTFIKKLNDTQAIYETLDNKYIGIELYDNDKQAVMYKKGTVETWDIWEDVSFEPEHRLISSAKGEWIASLQVSTVSLGGVTYTVQNNGDLHDNNGLAFVFMNNPRKTPIIRTPHDNKERDRAIYKSYGKDEYLGILIDNRYNNAFFYKNNKTDFWNLPEQVSFDPIHEIDPTSEFINGAKGTYPNTQDYYNSKFREQSIIILDNGNIFIDNRIRYILNGVINSSQAIYTSTIDNKFIGVEYGIAPNKTLKLYKKNSIENWASSDDVRFDPAHYVDILVAYINSLISDFYKLGDDLYIVKNNGDVHPITGTKTYTYVGHYKEGWTYDRTKLIYKTTDNKYVGIYHNPIAKTIDLYMENGAYNGLATAWANQSDITRGIFIPENKVSPIGNWNSINPNPLNVEPIKNLASTIDTNVNANFFYIFYGSMKNNTQDKGKGIVQKHDPQTGNWTRIGDEFFTKRPIENPSIVVDGAQNLYTVYRSGQIYIQKYNFATKTWIDYGNSKDLMTGSDNSIPALTINQNNTLFLAYRKNSKTIIESRIDSKVWTQLGSSVFPNETLFDIDTAITTYGDKVYIVIAGRQQGSFYEPQLVRVAEWNGTTWKELNSNGAGTGSSPSINVNNKGEVYVAFRDEDGTRMQNGYPTVKKWNGSVWVTVGNNRWGNTVVGDITLDFYNDDDTPVVLYGGSSGASAPTKAFYYNEDLKDWIRIGREDQVSDNSSSISYYTVGNIALDNTIFTAFGDLDNGTTYLKAKKHNIHD